MFSLPPHTKPVKPPRHAHSTWAVFKKWPGLYQLTKFALVGGATGILDVALFFTLRGLGMYFLFANMISLGIAILINFYINRRWTFRHTDGARAKYAFTEFFILNGGFYFLQQILLYCGVLLFPAPLFMISSDLIIKVILVVGLGTIKFFISRCWIFRKK